MVRFHGLCDGKIMLKKNSSFCVEMSIFFAKTSANVI